MGGRPAKPLQLHLANGNRRHLTKAEIATRQKQENRLRSSIRPFKPGPQVKNDMVALAMFKKLQKLYKSIDYVEGLDENVINRYCLLQSEYVRMRDTRQLLTDQSINSPIEERVFLTDKILEMQAPGKENGPAIKA